MSNFDPSDPYDAASAWYCFFTCDTCPAHLDFAAEARTGLDYLDEQGQRAKADGWYVVDDSAGGHVRYILRCPQCVREAGVGLPARDLRVTPHEAVSAICGLEARADGLPKA